MFRIDPADMKQEDLYALARWKETTDPQTGRSKLLIRQLARELNRCTATVYHLTVRLEKQGFIKKHHKHGKSGAEIEVLVKE